MRSSKCESPLLWQVLAACFANFWQMPKLKGTPKEVATKRNTAVRHINVITMELHAGDSCPLLVNCSMSHKDEAVLS